MRSRWASWSPSGAAGRSPAREPSRLDLSPTSGPDADQARSDVREIIGRKGHAVVNARDALDRLDIAFDDGSLERTPFLAQATGDLRVALEQDDDQKLGGKSAEASRFILRAIDRGLDDA
jgi:hypothetical protein